MGLRCRGKSAYGQPQAKEKRHAPLGSFAQKWSASIATVALLVSGSAAFFSYSADKLATDISQLPNASVSLEPAFLNLEHGGSGELTVTVRNRGHAPLGDLVLKPTDGLTCGAITEQLAPGTSSAAISCKISKWSHAAGSSVSVAVLSHGTSVGVATAPVGTQPHKLSIQNISTSSLTFGKDVVVTFEVRNEGSAAVSKFEVSTGRVGDVCERFDADADADADAVGVGAGQQLETVATDSHQPASDPEAQGSSKSEAQGSIEPDSAEIFSCALKNLLLGTNAVQFQILADNSEVISRTVTIQTLVPACEITLLSGDVAMRALDVPAASVQNGVRSVPQLAAAIQLAVSEIEVSGCDGFPQPDQTGWVSVKEGEPVGDCLGNEIWIGGDESTAQYRVVPTFGTAGADPCDFTAFHLVGIADSQELPVNAALAVISLALTGRVGDAQLVYDDVSQLGVSRCGGDELQWAVGENGSTAAHVKRWMVKSCAAG